MKEPVTPLDDTPSAHQHFSEESAVFSLDEMEMQICKENMEMYSFKLATCQLHNGNQRGDREFKGMLQK